MDESNETTTTPVGEASPTTGQTISVYISGEVAKPGVYTLPQGSRIVDAVAAAGGALSDADLENVNLAQKLEDEDHVTVYRIGAVATTTTPGGKSPTVVDTGTPAISLASPTGEPKPGPTTQASGPAKPTPAIKINLNTATEEQLELLPGIGPSIAQRIISDRQQNGPFRSVEDLTRISGIKEGILAKIRDYVTVTP